MPLKPKQITEHKWRGGLLWYVGSLGMRLENIAKTQGFVVEHFEEDGLGPAAGIAVALPSGRVVVMKEYQHSIDHFGQTGPTIEADAADVVEYGFESILAEVLDSFQFPDTVVAHRPGPDSDGEARLALERLDKHRSGGTTEGPDHNDRAT